VLCFCHTFVTCNITSYSSSKSKIKKKKSRTKNKIKRKTENKKINITKSIIHNSDNSGKCSLSFEVITYLVNKTFYDY